MNEQEPDSHDEELWIVTYDHRNPIAQYVLFLETITEYTYPEYPKRIYNNPETTEGGW